MFAISFDLVVEEVTRHHPKGVSAAYTEVGRTVKQFDFDRAQGSVYTTENEDLSNLMRAVLAFKALQWFPPSTGNVRVFRMEHGSDLTALIKD